MTKFLRPSLAAVMLATLISAPSGLLAPSTAALNPGSITKSPSVWLDASDPDADGVNSNNPADGTELNIWRDKSGNGNDAVLVSGGIPATYETTNNQEFAGKPTLNFTRQSDSVGTRFTVPFDLRSTSNPNVTIFAVYKPTVIEANLGVWGSDNGSWDRFFLAYHSAFGDGINDGAVATGPSTIGITVQDAALLDKPRLSAVRYAGNIINGENIGATNASAVFFDGDLVARFTDLTDAQDAQSQLFIGADGDDSIFSGEIAEILVYPYALTDAEIRAVSTYIHNNYDLAKLPVSIGVEKTTVFKGTEINTLPFVTEPTTSVDDWEILPVCNAFAKNDKQFSNPLTGKLPIGKYVTYCSGGLSNEYATAEYLTGSLRVMKIYGLTRTSVFFEPYSTELSSSAKQKLNKIIAKADRINTVSLSVKGFVRPTSTNNNDMSLSTERARVVAHYLKRLLNKNAKVQIRGMGATDYNQPSSRKAMVWLKFDRRPV